ncbi:MAG: SUMF1/EgtB/PvdO family nonheme iron enzyme [Candidatus Magnetomorum sp.]|nr:SUMF1/EgtB/PvdO family nonheme iron enzyme [Candidatus Magnetomorum sp.]
MSVIISQERIEKAITSLHYTDNSVKRKLIDLVMKSYETHVDSIPEPLDTDDLIRQLWDIQNSEEIVYKRKNFHSLKTSVNSDFQRLYRSGLNPDGIVIGNENIFDISNEARDTIFAKFATGSGKERAISLEQLFDYLNVIERAISSTDFIQQDTKQNEFFLSKLDQTLSSVMEKFAQSEDDEKKEPEVSEDEKKDDDDEYEIIEEIIEEVDEEEDDDEDIVQEEIIEEEIIEEIDDDDAEEEIVEEVIEEIEEIEEIGDDDEEEEEEDYEEETIEIEDDLVEVIDAGLPVGTLGLDKAHQFTDDGILKERILLDEKLDGYLGSMERFYNQYLLIDEDKYIIGTKHPERHEIKRKKILLEDFYMGKFPVTNLLFSIFINKTGYVTTAERLGYGMVYTGRFLKKNNPNTGKKSVVLNSALSCKKQAGACWHRPLGLGSDLNQKRNHPVVQVSIEDAMAFAQWVNKRIPTETEWEAGARTQKGVVFPWGNKWKKNRCNIEATANADTTPVDKYQKWENALGIVDTLGNVLEWTCTQFEDQQNNKTYFIAKGGSWISNNKPYLYQRSLHYPGYSSNIIGFRCVV